MGTPNWFDLGNAGEWIAQALAERGMRLTGRPDAFCTRPWSMVIRVPSSAGSLDFKAVSPELRHEVALTRLTGAQKAEYAAPVPSLLQEFLEFL